MMFEAKVSTDYDGGADELVAKLYEARMQSIDLLWRLRVAEAERDEARAMRDYWEGEARRWIAAAQREAADMLGIEEEVA